MDASDPASFTHRKEKLSTGHTYHFIDQLPSGPDPTSRPTLLCVHGFPDLWYGWRHQIGPWVKRGYRVVVTDTLGYGQTDKPHDIAAYTTKRICADLAALLDCIGVQKAVLIGHDWGSQIVGRFALWHPDRILALVQLSVAWTPPPREYIPPEEVGRRYPDLGYQIYFADPASTKEIESNLAVVWQNMFCKSAEAFTKPGECRQLALGGTTVNTKGLLLTEKETEYYLTHFRGAMNGPLNYYRTTKLRYDEERDLPSNLPASLPALLFWGTEDPTCVPANVRRARKFIPRLEDVRIEGCGHWLMIEAKDLVTDTVIRFLDNVGLSPPSSAKL